MATDSSDKAVSNDLDEDLDPIHGVVEGASDFISWSRVDGTLEYINPAGRAMVGRELGAGLAKENIAAFHPAWAYEIVREVALPLALEHGTWTGETALLHADGTEIPVLQAIAAHRSRAGKPSYISTICRDLRPFRRLQQVALASERRYRAFVEASPMGIHAYELRPDGRLVFVGANPGADRILGIENAAFVGKTIEEAFPPLANTEIPARYRDAAAEGRLWHTEQISYDHGRIRGAFEVYAFQTGPGAMAAMFLDITARKQAEAAREKLEEQLRQAQKMEAIGRLAGGVAHDFNNILTAIAGYAEQLALSLPEGDPRRFEVGEIIGASDRAARMTRQLLSFARKQPVLPRVLDVNRLVSDAQQMLARLIGEHIALEFRPNTPLWGVCVDPTQLEQVLINLVVNARDAMPSGGSLTITTRNEHGFPSDARGLVPAVPAPEQAGAGSAEPAGSTGGTLVSRPAAPARFVTIAVRDTGIGMGPEVLEHAFEPFFSTKEVGRGTGLGLATVYGIVHQAGGRLEVESRPGQGTTFRIHLPAVDGVIDARERAVSGHHGGSETILVVEDDARVRELCLRLLEREGYRVFNAERGSAAIELAASLTEPVALLLTDVVMPGMNGKELYRQLRAGWPDLKVLYMSGFDEQVVAEHGLLEEGTHLLQKPFTIAALGARVREVLDS